jgi:hypothetical protein
MLPARASKRDAAHSEGSLEPVNPSASGRLGAGSYCETGFRSTARNWFFVLDTDRFAAFMQQQRCVFVQK